MAQRGRAGGAGPFDHRTGQAIGVLLGSDSAALLAGIKQGLSPHFGASLEHRDGLAFGRFLPTVGQGAAPFQYYPLEVRQVVENAVGRRKRGRAPKFCERYQRKRPSSP